MKKEISLRVVKLSSGFFRVRGNGPCEFGQYSSWPPLDERALLEETFPEASESFREAVRKMMRARDDATL